MREEHLSRHIERQRLARKEAEQLLENKSRELYAANEKLREHKAELEQRVAERTQDLEQALSELAQSRDQALQASKMKSEFLANMSHEIRTPLNGIVGTTELIMDMAQDRDQLDLLSTLKLSSDTLLHLINDILDFSKIEQGKLELEKRNFNLGDLCDNVIQLFSSTAKDKHLELKTQYSETPLPSVTGDPTRLRQILSNLISNALKFTHSGTVTLKVDVLTEQAAVAIKVTDTGIGISQDKQAHLFDPFTQADNSTTRKYGGSGLGLAICAQLTELMQGSIEVKSEPNAGSTFSLKLPMPTVNSDSSHSTSAMNGHLEIDQHLWVLLVDDNLINRKVGTRLIESMHCSVMLAESGQEALDACRNNHFDLVLMDIQMPGMDGTEAMHEIRALERKSPPIVALTAHALQGDREHYLTQGFDDYLAKPLKKAALWEVLSKVSNSSETTEAVDAKTTNALLRPIVLNRSIHREFVALMESEYQGLVERYQQDLLAGCKEILEHGDDIARIRKIAHRLKSSAGYLGAERMRAVLEWLEHKYEQASVNERLTTAKIAMNVAEDTCRALQEAK